MDFQDEESLSQPGNTVAQTFGRCLAAAQQKQKEASQPSKRKKDDVIGGTTSADDPAAPLHALRSHLQSAVRKIGEARADPAKGINATSILELIEMSLQCLNTVLSKKGRLFTSPPTSPAAKQPRSDPSAPPALPARTMVDASTDMELTPAHWDSLAARTAADNRRKRPPRTTAPQRPPDTGADTGADTEAEDWSAVAGRRARRAKTAAAVASRPPAVSQPLPSASSSKAPAILVRRAVGKSFADTVRAVRNCGLTAQDLGASIKMRETRDGELLLELPKGAKSSSTAKTIAVALGDKLGDSVGKVSPLGVQVEIEILDLDAVSSAAEVLHALRAAIPGDDPAAVAEREAIDGVQIWTVRGGQQVATAKVSRFVASKVSRIAVGWTMCRVRPRTPPPERCFRCQAFGHNARNCTADTDRTGACWRCGKTGHAMSNCKESVDNCLACHLAGLPKVNHKPGSGACPARKQAARPTTSPANA